MPREQAARGGRGSREGESEWVLKHGTMATIVISHKVGNFDTWLKGHQDRVNSFTPLVKNFQTFQNAGDPNSIAMVMEVTDLDKLAEMVNDPAMKPIKDKHTVIDPINVYVQVKV
jgi:hypothetical protein